MCTFLCFLYFPHEIVFHFLVFLFLSGLLCSVHLNLTDSKWNGLWLYANELLKQISLEYWYFAPLRVAFLFGGSSFYGIKLQITNTTKIHYHLFALFFSLCLFNATCFRRSIKYFYYNLIKSSTGFARRQTRCDVDWSLHINLLLLLFYVNK